MKGFSIKKRIRSKQKGAVDGIIPAQEEACLKTHIAGEAEAEVVKITVMACPFIREDVAEVAVEISAADAAEVAGLRPRLKSLSKNSCLDLDEVP